MTRDVLVRRRRALQLVALALAATVAACDGATGPVRFDGSYYLLQVDRKTVPVIIEESAVIGQSGDDGRRFIVRITGGLLEVLSDSGVHWREDFHAVTVTASGDTSVASWGYRGKYGTYRREGSRIVLRFPEPRPDGSLGTLEDTATLTSGGVNWRRRPLGAGASTREFDWRYVRP